MKLNKGKDIDILLHSPKKSTEGNKLEFTIKNNSNKIYIIDPLGFYGSEIIIANGKVLKQTYFDPGHYYRETLNQCQEDFIILQPKQEIKTYIDWAYNDKRIYSIIKQENFKIIVKSVHNRETATMLGCNSYIESLEKKGYKVLEDSIDAEIPYKNEE